MITSSIIATALLLNRLLDDRRSYTENSHIIVLRTRSVIFLLRHQSYDHIFVSFLIIFLLFAVWRNSISSVCVCGERWNRISSRWTNLQKSFIIIINNSLNNWILSTDPPVSGRPVNVSFSFFSLILSLLSVQHENDR